MPKSPTLSECVEGVMCAFASQVGSIVRASCYLQAGGWLEASFCSAKHPGGERLPVGIAEGSISAPVYRSKASLDQRMESRRISPGETIRAWLCRIDAHASGCEDSTPSTGYDSHEQSKVGAHEFELQAGDSSCRNGGCYLWLRRCTRSTCQAGGALGQGHSNF